MPAQLKNTNRVATMVIRHARDEDRLLAETIRQRLREDYPTI
jgi:hypothetical protein